MSFFKKVTEVWASILFGLALTPPAFADMGLDVVEAQVKGIYVAQRFQDSENVEAYIEVGLPDLCHRLDETTVDFDEEWGVFSITQKAIVYNATCAQQYRTTDVRVPLGVLPEGDYIIQTEDGSIYKQFSVVESRATGPNGVQIAPVRLLETTMIETPYGSKVFGQLEGLLTSNCVAWEGIRLETEGDRTIIVPKIIQVQRRVCEDQAIPFDIVVEIPLSGQHAKHLLNVKTRGGASINQLVNL